MTLDTARGILFGSRHRPKPGLFERVRMHLSHAATQQDLSGLNDRLLRDMGISRAQIELREYLN